jgi:5-formyltetrahydrofolate cyclo-ligase
MAKPAGDPTAAKETLRRQMRGIRRAIPPEERARRGRLITRSLRLLPQLRRAEVVLAFSSFGSEVPTEELLGSLKDAGVTLFLPFLDSGDMKVAEYRLGDRLVETAYGPLEPFCHRPAEPSRIGAVIVPGLAFDPRGGRLGYGGGHYDRFLPRLGAGATLIGVAFNEQVVPEVPMGENDVRLDLVVTDLEVIDCREDRMPGAR